MNPVRQLLKSVIETVVPQSLLLSRGRHLVETGEATTFHPAVSLTFDDGPHPEFTSVLLDNLASCGLRGTFFVVGERAQRYPELLRRMADEGHEVGNHTWTHSEPRETSTAKFLDEVKRTRAFIEDTIGRECRLMRPPKGELTAGKLCALIRSGQTVVLWNHDPRDYRMESYCEMEDWCRDYRAQHGDIVLMHDNHPHAATAAFLLGTQRATAGLRYVTVSEWLGRKAPKREMVEC